MITVEQNYTINGEVVTKEFESGQIAIYLDGDSQTARIVHKQTGKVVASIYLDPYSGEGGGGDLRVREGCDG